MNHQHFPILIFLDIIEEKSITNQRSRRLPKELKLFNDADITAMSKDLLISAETIKRSFTRELLETKQDFHSNYKKTIRGILLRKTMKDKVCGLIHYLPETSDDSEARFLVLRNLARILYSNQHYLEIKDVDALKKLSGINHFETKDVLIKSILAMRNDIKGTLRMYQNR